MKFTFSSEPSKAIDVALIPQDVFNDFIVKLPSALHAFNGITKKKIYEEVIWIEIKWAFCLETWRMCIHEHKICPRTIAVTNMAIDDEVNRKSFDVKIGHSWNEPGEWPFKVIR